MKIHIYIIGICLAITVGTTFKSGVCSELTLPQDFDFSRRCESLLDRGYLWNYNAMFHPLSVDDGIDTTVRAARSARVDDWMFAYIRDHYRSRRRIHNLNSDQLGVMLMTGVGLSGQADPEKEYEGLAVQPFLWGEAVLQRNLYARLYLRTTNQAASLDHYTGITRSIARAGMNTAEIDQSVIGYQNQWLNLEYGCSREIWGPLAEDNLVLSGHSPAWERLMMQLQYRRFTFRWFYGFLEAITDSADQCVQRYIVGRALEYNNHRNFVLAIGEVSILAGPNRPLDMAFLNPLAIHLEVEQNDRMNSDHNYADAIVFLHMDWLMTSRLRLSGSLIVDDFQIDEKDRLTDADGLGKLVRLAYTPVSAPFYLTLLSSYVRLDTYTLQHQYPYCNWVTRGVLLGHPIGNDADQISAGLRVVLRQPVSLEIQFGRRRWGDNSLMLDDRQYTPYQRYIRQPFPSGELRENRFISVALDSQPTKRLSVGIAGHVDINHHGLERGLEKWTFQLRYQIPFIFAK